jgi:hypothetical protein
MAEIFNLADHLHEGLSARLAWIERLHQAANDPDTLARFQVETGTEWLPGTTLEEVLLDQASSESSVFFETFVPWFNVSIWGEVQ